MKRLTNTLTSFVIILLLGNGLISCNGTLSYVGDVTNKGIDAYQAGDFATAIQVLKPLAKKGDSNAQFLLALMYDYGQGVPQNHKTAVK